MKKKILAIGVIVILLACLAVGTFAYETVKGITTNVITMGTVRLDLDEMALNQDTMIGRLDNIVPAMKVTKVPIVENTGSEPFYSRVYVVIEATAADGKTPLSADCVKLWLDKTVEDTADKDWFMAQGEWIVEEVDDENDNVYTAYLYYNGIVEPGQQVAPFNIVEFTGAMDNSYVGGTITVKLCAQAVQSKNNPMPEEGITAVPGWPELPEAEEENP